MSFCASSFVTRLFEDGSDARAYKFFQVFFFDATDLQEIEVREHVMGVDRGNFFSLSSCLRCVLRLLKRLMFGGALVDFFGRPERFLVLLPDIVVLYR